MRGSWRQLLSRKVVTSGDTISERLGAYDESTDTYDWPLYFAYILERVVPPLFFAIVTLVAVPVLVILRCCGCCGGRHPSFGLCCGAQERDGEPRRYTKREQTLVVRLLAGVLVVAVLSGIVVYIGNDKISVGIRETTGGIVATGHRVLSNVLALYQGLTRISTTMGARQSLEDGVNAGRDIMDRAESLESTILNFDASRATVLHLSYVVPIVAVGVGLGLGLIGFTGGWVQFWMGVLVLLALVLMWVSVSLHLLLSIIFADGCTEVDLYLAGDANGLDALLLCDPESFSTFTDTIDQGLDASASLGCMALGGFCARPEVPGTPVGCAPVCDAVSFPHHDNVTVQATTYASPSVAETLTLAKCATLCNDDTLREEALVIWTHIQEHRNLTAMKPSAQDLVSCDWIRNLVVSTRVAVCDELAPGLRMVAYSHLVLAVVLNVGVVLLVKGVKRFNNDYIRSDNRVEPDLEQNQPPPPYEDVPMKPVAQDEDACPSPPFSSQVV